MQSEFTSLPLLCEVLGLTPYKHSDWGSTGNSSYECDFENAAGDLITIRMQIGGFNFSFDSWVVGNLSFGVLIGDKLSLDLTDSGDVRRVLSTVFTAVLDLIDRLKSTPGALDAIIMFARNDDKFQSRLNIYKRSAREAKSQMSTRGFYYIDNVTSNLNGALFCKVKDLHQDQLDEINDMIHSNKGFDE